MNIEVREMKRNGYQWFIAFTYLYFFFFFFFHLPMVNGCYGILTLFVSVGLSSSATTAPGRSFRKLFKMKHKEIETKIKNQSMLQFSIHFRSDAQRNECC